MKIPAQRILVIVTRRIGDVLLAGALIRSLRRGYPEARLHALVFKGTGGVLEGNPDLDQVIEMSEKPGPREYARLLWRLARRYDLALSTLAGDRPHFMALLAGRRRVGIVPPADRRSAWKRRLCQAWTELDNLNTHTVEQYLRLVDCLEIPRVAELVAPSAADAGAHLDALLPFDWHRVRYAVLHPIPKWRYKQWHAAGWHAVLGYLEQRGMRVVMSGGPGPQEARYMAELLAGAPGDVVNLVGRLSLAQSADLLRGAAVFVGPDTAITHMAAACGIPTVALYGPSNPVKWGPWPRGYARRESPYRNRAPLQRVGNVALLQGEGDCVPCHEEGCERHLHSYSRCLDELPAARVCDALERLLGS